MSACACVCLTAPVYKPIIISGAAADVDCVICSFDIGAQNSEV